MSDELIEAMARACLVPLGYPADAHLTWRHTYIGGYANDEPADLKSMCEDIARALLPVIRAHLEPTSEMLANTVTSDGRMRIMEFTTIEERGEAFMVPRYIWRAMLAASPIGDVG